MNGKGEGWSDGHLLPYFILWTCSQRANFCCFQTSTFVIVFFYVFATIVFLANTLTWSISTIVNNPLKVSSMRTWKSNLHWKAFCSTSATPNSVIIFALSPLFHISIIIKVWASTLVCNYNYVSFVVWISDYGSFVWLATLKNSTIVLSLTLWRNDISASKVGTSFSKAKK